MTYNKGVISLFQCSIF